MIDPDHDPRFDPPPPPGQNTRSSRRRRLALLLLSIAVAAFLLEMWIGSSKKATWASGLAAAALFVLSIAEYALGLSADAHTRDGGPYSESTTITR